MRDVPAELDSLRGMAAQRATEERRLHPHKFQIDQEALRQQQDDLETLLLEAPAETWPEAAAKARFLIDLFAMTLEAQDPRRKELIAQSLADLSQLSERAKPRL